MKNALKLDFSGPTMTPNALERLRVLFRGSVQGVGFRYTTQSIAEKFDVHGYVQNLSDGSVELVAEGSRRELESFLQAIQVRMEYHIRDCKTDYGAASGEFASFSIRF
jgi:acylphosphatase